MYSESDKSRNSHKSLSRTTNFNMLCPQESKRKQIILSERALLSIPPYPVFPWACDKAVSPITLKGQSLIWFILKSIDKFFQIWRLQSVFIFSILNHSDFSLVL